MATARRLVRERRRRRLRNRLRSIVRWVWRSTLVMGGLAGLAFGVYQVHQFVFDENSEYFGIYCIRVSGSTIEKSEILDAAGIEYGKNIFRFDARRAKKRLLEAYSCIADAEFARVLPRQLEIRVVMRQPVLRLARRGCVVDRSGTPFERTAGDTGVLPLLLGRKSEDIQIGVPLGDEKTARALLLTEQFRQATPKLYAELEAVDVSSGRQIILRMPKYSIRCSGEEEEREFEALGRVLVDVAAKGLELEYVDLRFAGQIVTKPRDGQGKG